MDWFLIWIGYTLISVSVSNNNSFWLNLFNKFTFVAGATIVTVQILMHLGVS